MDQKELIDRLRRDPKAVQSLMTSAREHREMFSAILQLVKTADKEYEKELRDKSNPRRRD